jgi:hypothetical protein
LKEDEIPYRSVNEQENIPEHVVDEMNRLHNSDRGISMGENWPPTEPAQSEQTTLVYCTRCCKTHAVTAGETPCAPGAWIEHDGD